jgi:hypothetical protein
MSPATFFGLVAIWSGMPCSMLLVAMLCRGFG